MSSLNKVTLLGRLGGEPETRCTQSGKTMCSFSLATSETRTVNDQKTETTEWHKVVAWEKLAEVISKYVHRGDLLLVEGKIHYVTTEHREEKRYFTQIIATNIVLMPKAKDSPHPAQSAPANDYPSYGDDVPF